MVVYIFPSNAKTLHGTILQFELYPFLFTYNVEFYLKCKHSWVVRAYCGGLEMAPHENKWSPLDGAHE